MSGAVFISALLSCYVSGLFGGIRHASACLDADGRASRFDECPINFYQRFPRDGMFRLHFHVYFAPVWRHVYPIWLLFQFLVCLHPVRRDLGVSTEHLPFGSWWFLSE